MAGELIEVELDDEPPGSTPRGRPRRPWSLRRWGGLAAVLAVLATAASAATATDSASRAGRGGLLGFTTDLSVPRHILWEISDEDVLGLAGGNVLLLSRTGTGVRAARLQDGSTAWRVDAGFCQPIGSTGTRDPATPQRVVCQDVTDPFGGPMHTQVVDAATGATLVTLPAGGGAALGDLWVDVEPDSPGGAGVTVSVWSLRDGKPRWSRHYDVDLSGGYGLSESALIVGEGSTAVAIDLTTGAVHPGASAGQTVATVEAPGGITITATWVDGSMRLSALDPTGATLWAKEDAFYVASGAEDPAARSVLVVEAMDNGELVALDAATGRELWRSSTGRMLVHVPGVVAVDGTPGRVLDDRTGQTLWVPSAGEHLVAVSDRELVLVRSVTDDELVVRDLRDGHAVVRYRVGGLNLTPPSDTRMLGGWGWDGAPVPGPDGTILLSDGIRTVVLGP
ncbi:PQQ-binding-like beta-propeller repeat protein [Isoptericola sp. b441]|uniref:PQQ-binding-like beta-propeller repeat protein n=1 Tax=Actinotalea lenta TaxID=3064654 RepID=A0ABT9DB20_9CELL|nr:PQQ-binding-like beta-propeller repeat protein [Isoptericola sp. b441]MDO8108092.1 PQQ-binding-like beta-propeller repeat protein [Isoptericola sp. b441]